MSSTDTDREIQLALDRAAREIETALRIASESPLDRNRKRRTTGDLRRALDSVTQVSYLGPPHSERESYEDWKARREQKRQARVEARNARREQADG